MTARARFRSIAVAAALAGTLSQPAVAQFAPGDSGLGPGDHMISHNFEGLRREYLVHVPPGYDRRTLIPLVIMLHGSGGTIDWDLKATGWNNKADNARFVVVYPQARPRENGITAFGDDDIPFISNIIDEMRSRLRLDLNRLYVTGFSNGGWFSFRLGLKLANRIAAIAPVAGLPRLDSTSLVRPVPALFIIGTRDEFNPIDGGEIVTPTATRQRPPVRPSVFTWGERLGCPSAPSDSSYREGISSETFGPCQKKSELIVKVIDDWQHYWPGGARAPRKGGGDLDMWAEDTIWEFFRRHPK